MPCAASVTGTDETLGARVAAAPIWLPASPLTNETPGYPESEHAAPEVLVKTIGTYVLPAAPPPWLLARLTDSAEVLHLPGPGAVEERDDGAAAGVPAPGAVLAPAIAELPADDAADDGDAGVLPDDPQPAAVAAAATSHATARPGRALAENVIISIPFVLAGQVLREPDAHLPGAPQPLSPVLPSRPPATAVLNVSLHPEYLLGVTTCPARACPFPAPSGVQACSAAGIPLCPWSGRVVMMGRETAERTWRACMPGASEFSTRPELAGTFGMVASTHWLAGLSVLEKGGNAFDAAVAAGLVLQVVEPHVSGPGGEVPIIGFDARRGQTFVVDGQGPAPRAATPGAFARGGMLYAAANPRGMQGYAVGR